MTNNITMIIILVAYFLGAFVRLFVNKVPEKYIPIQNIIIGFISALICYFMKLEPNFLDSLFTCLMATMSAGGIQDLVNKLKTTANSSNNIDVG